MINSRRKLQTVLEGVLGSNHVYFQPPESVKLVYPCLVYEFDNINAVYSNNVIYKAVDRYTITHIYEHVSDATLVDDILDLPYAAFDRTFISDNLYHDVYTIYVLHE